MKPLLLFSCHGLAEHPFEESNRLLIIELVYRHAEKLLLVAGEEIGDFLHAAQRKLGFASKDQLEELAISEAVVTRSSVVLQNPFLQEDGNRFLNDIHFFCSCYFCCFNYSVSALGMMISLKGG